jgi:lincosamide nucleotidyltransferase A/C/D/E
MAEDMAEAMTAEQAVTLYELLDARGVRCWVMGGWGVDALLGRVTREHKDLDLLVHRADLATYAAVTRRGGFARKLEWSESRSLEIGGVTYDSAFVDVHPDGREIDVHVVDVQHGELVQFHDGPWPLPTDALSGRGTLVGRAVRCVSRAAQLAMHSGYDLPGKHRADVQLLQPGLE